MQHKILARLQSVEAKPWTGLLNYFRTMKAERDALHGTRLCHPEPGLDGHL